MIERVNKDNLAEYEDFIKKHPKGLFQHSSKWAKVKSAWKWEAIMLKDDNGKIIGSASVLIRFIPVIKYSLFYVCRGFVADENDFDTFDKLFNSIRAVWILKMFSRDLFTVLITTIRPKKN